MITYIEHFDKHPNYNPDNEHNDIALLKLVQPVTLNHNIQVACLPKYTYFNSTSYPPINSKAIAVGWRIMEATVLLNFRLTIYGQNQCSDPFYKSVDWTIQICCGDILSITGPCEGI